MSNLGHGLPNDLLDQALLRLTRLAAFMAVLMTVSITGHTVNNYISGVALPALSLGGRGIALLAAALTFVVARHAPSPWYQARHGKPRQPAEVRVEELLKGQLITPEHSPH